jgi:hypothetical protein
MGLIPFSSLLFFPGTSSTFIVPSRSGVVSRTTSYREARLAATRRDTRFADRFFSPSGSSLRVGSESVVAVHPTPRVVINITPERRNLDRYARLARPAYLRDEVHSPEVVASNGRKGYDTEFYCRQNCLPVYWGTLILGYFV